jgi:N utilization substance protein B
VRKRTLARVLLLGAIFQVDVGNIDPVLALGNVLDDLDAEILTILTLQDQQKKEKEAFLRSLRTTGSPVSAEKENAAAWLDDEKFRAFISDNFNGILAHLSELDSSIVEKIKNWDIERVARVELNILRMALYEMMYRDDIPRNVSIDEAVELAKIFGDKDSGRFVNGILGAITTDEVKKNDR